MKKDTKKWATPAINRGDPWIVRRYAISIDDVLMWWRRGELNPRPKTHSWEPLRAQTVIAEVLLSLFPFRTASRHAIRSGELHDSWYAQSFAYARAPLVDA